MINAAIAGLGRWGRNLVDASRGAPGLQFTAANSRARQTAEPYCRERGLRWTADLDDILRDPSIGAVVFATPHSLHAAQAQRAAAAGKHVFVEKPFALNLADAKRMIAVAENANVVLAAGFNRRFHPSMIALRTMLRAGELGTPVTISAEQTALHGLDLTADAWRAQTNEAPGGAMTAIGVHLVDGMIDLLGPIATVTARVTRRAATHADDTTNVLLEFQNGATGHIYCSTVSAPTYRMAVHGTAGYAEILGHAMNTLRIVRAAPGDHFRTGAPEVRETAGFNMLTAELNAFAESIAARRPFPTPLSEVLHGVAVFDAVLRSAAAGTTIAVEPVA